MRIKLVAIFLLIIFVVFSLLSDKVFQFRFVQDIAAAVTAPFQEAINTPFDSLAKRISSAKSMDELIAENNMLKEEVYLLRQQVATLKELERENAALRQYMELRSAFPELRFIEAGVIGSDPSNIVKAITINKGSDEGIISGMTVMTPGGLVGQVIQVTKSTSKVLLISDTSNSVTALVQGSRAQGVVNGERSKYLRMRYLPQSAILNVGDKVITSGIGGVYPPGILVGGITSFSKKDTDIFQEAIIETAVDLNSLEVVLVVINYIPIKLETR